MSLIKHACRVIAGQSPSGDDVTDLDGGMPFLQGKAEFGSHSPEPRYECATAPKIAPRGSVLVSVRAPVGAVNMADRAYGIGRGLAAVVPARASAVYVRYLMEARAPYLRSLATGSTFEAIAAADIGGIAVPVEPLSEQQAIEDYLDRETAKIDTLIEKQTTMIERLRERQAAVISTAVADRGDAVTLASLSQRGGFFDGDWVESKDQDPQGEIRLLQLADVGDGQFRDRSDRRVNAATFARLRCSALRADDILIARMPDPLGRACVLPSDQAGAITVVDVAVLRVDHARAVPKYVMYALNSAAARSAIEVQQDGATRQRIPRKKLGKIALPVPPLDEQREIAAYLDRETAKIDNLIAKVERHIELAKERRAALITAAVTGQIDVTTSTQSGDAA
ncbi:restriction endonuclease subunit S [Dermacoccus profundi]|uniref:Restriction endonuclease subunit S n=3 Tax=Dermacoccaceae TaxID=145357 RepID=A0A417Z1G6_9MICO|nr:restriction endonuclease subunit S [Dermacoccus abyssi]